MGRPASPCRPATRGHWPPRWVRLLGDERLRARLGAAGRERVLARFTWAKAAEGTVVHYRAAIEQARSRRSR